jgi:hypothetical protein
VTEPKWRWLAVYMKWLALIFTLIMVGSIIGNAVLAAFGM